ncbi:MAG: N-acetylneuraminate synthase family protein, partial [Pseudomonadales bacterium]|nr:N-acetylneuraminate synthase family protein [Pseudomonadales bacterium]
MILEYNLTPWLVRAGTPLKQAIAQLDAGGLRMLLCVDDTGRLVGTFTPGDLNRWLLSDAATSLDVDVASVVQTRPRVRRVDADAREISDALEQVNFLPLVDAEHRLRAMALRRELARGIRIGDRIVDEERPAFVIAEIGNNHNGSLDEALRLIDLAAEAGADCAKFQMRDMSVLYGDEVEGDDSSENLGAQYTLDLLRRFQLSDEALFTAFDHCRARGLVPLCTPWDASSVDKLEQYGLPAYKVASADLTNHDLLRHLARTGKPLICSTGMSTEAEVRQSIELLQRCGAQFVLLHCNSTYPTPFKDVRLAYMDRLREAGNCLVGYSGHERDIFVPVA